MSSRSPDGSPLQPDVQAPGLSLSQRRVLERLKRAGATTIPVLAGALSLNVETVRHHLRALEQLGYVERRGTRRPGPGRPEVVYALTDRAEGLFPDRQGEILQGLAAYLKETGNASLIEEFFERWISSRRQRAKARVEGLEGTARLQEVAAIMAELGFMASANVAAGRAQLHLCNCPLRDLVEVSRVPCRMEIAFMRELLGEELTRLSYIPAGDASCSYEPTLLTREQVPGAAAS
jgi:predicted ArsR family transcriptional regulator